MWEYEISKKTEKKENTIDEPAVFCIRKMWKEFSCLILSCTTVKKDIPGIIFEGYFK